MPNPLLAEVDRWIREAVVRRTDVVDPAASSTLGALTTAVSLLLKVCAGDREVPGK